MITIIYLRQFSFLSTISLLPKKKAQILEKSERNFSSSKSNCYPFWAYPWCNPVWRNIPHDLRKKPFGFTFYQLLNILQSSSNCDTIGVAYLKSTRSKFTGRFSISSAQTRTNNWSTIYCSCRCCMPGTELQPESTPSLPVKIVSIFEDGSTSPLKSAPWQDVLIHTVSDLELLFWQLFFRLKLDSSCGTRPACFGGC